MNTIDRKQELGFLLPVMIVNNMLETGKAPDIVAVRAVSLDIADEMETLGYESLTPDLLRAFMKHGDIEAPDSEQLVDLRGPAVSAFVGS